MSVHVIVGAQWGDEGKGKIVDHYADLADVVVRYAGGPNAGHTLVIGGKKIVLHQLPVGIVRSYKTCVVGPFVACDPDVLVQEIAIANAVMEEVKADLRATIWLDPRAPIILPVHRLIDTGREASAAGGKIGTTGRGIGPCYEDFIARRGVRLGDLRDARLVREALERGNYYAERMAVATMHGAEPADLEATIAWCMSYSDHIVPRLRDTVRFIQEMQAAGKKILMEGAQGILLDPIHGSRPNTTSSFCGPGGVTASFGLTAFERVTGVTKAYATRVGAGPFPTELQDDTGAQLRDLGNERGATTGRDRRTGWLDLPALAYAIRVGGITELVVTKLDVLGKLPEFKVCVEYAASDVADLLDTDALERAQPVTITLPGWSNSIDLTHIRSRSKLPIGARILLDTIEHTVNIPIVGIGTGAGRSDIIPLDR